MHEFREPFPPFDVSVITAVSTLNLFKSYRTFPLKELEHSIYQNINLIFPSFSSHLCSLLLKTLIQRVLSYWVLISTEKLARCLKLTRRASAWFQSFLFLSWVIPLRGLASQHVDSEFVFYFPSSRLLCNYRSPLPNRHLGEYLLDVIKIQRIFHYIIFMKGVLNSEIHFIVW